MVQLVLVPCPAALSCCPVLLPCPRPRLPVASALASAKMITLDAKPPESHCVPALVNMWTAQLQQTAIVAAPVNSICRDRAQCLL